MKNNVVSYPLMKRLRLRLRTKYSGYKNGDKILFPWYCGSEGNNKIIFNGKKNQYQYRMIRLIALFKVE